MSKRKRVHQANARAAFMCGLDPARYLDLLLAGRLNFVRTAPSGLWVYLGKGSCSQRGRHRV